jgi:hypothetical protein
VNLTGTTPAAAGTLATVYTSRIHTSQPLLLLLLLLLLPKQVVQEQGAALKRPRGVLLLIVLLVIMYGGYEADIRLLTSASL